MSATGILFSACILGLLVTVIVLGLRRTARHRPGEPSCGACGYAVRGLPSLTCPECGGDLREVGITTAQQRQPFGLGAYIALWTLILPLVGMLLIRLLGSTVIPQQVRASELCTLTRPRSMAYQDVSIQARSSTLRLPMQRPIFQAPMQTADVVLRPFNGPERTLHVRLGQLGYRYRDAKDQLVEQANGLSREIVLEWFESAGLDPESAAIHTEAADISKLLQSLGSGVRQWSGPTGFGGFRSTPRTSIGRLPGFTWGPRVLWFVVWLLGVRYLVRRLRRPIARSTGIVAATRPGAD